MKYLTTLPILFLVFIPLLFQAQDLPLITVEEKEIVYAEVDEIHFSLSILSHDLDIATARQKNKEASMKVLDFLQRKQIPKNYIQTKRLNISRKFKGNGAARIFTGFDATQTIYVCLKEINKYDEVLDGLMNMGIYRVDGPYFKSSQYETLRDAAQLLAIKKAKVKAEKMAAVLGQKIGSAKTITDQIETQSNTNTGYTSKQRGPNFTNRNSFEIGEIRIEARVKVAFHLLE